MYRALNVMEKFKVIKTIQETSDTTTIRFVSCSGKKHDFEPGQYITVRFPELDVTEGKAYSLSSLTSDDYMSITVKSIGKYSKRICGLKIDDVFTASTPYGYLFKDDKKPLVCIVAGVGVSPIWSIVRSVLNQDSNRKISLFYSNKTVNDIIFHDAILKMQNAFSGFNVINHITQQKITETNKYRHGRIEAREITRTILGNDASVIICGSQNFVVDTYKALQDGGVSEYRISTEIFFQNYGNM